MSVSVSTVVVNNDECKNLVKTETYRPTGWILRTHAPSEVDLCKVTQSKPKMKQIQAKIY